MPVFKNLISESFGRWLVVGYAGDSLWNCVCECGAASAVRGNHLTSGASASCGCLQKEVAVKFNTTHGRSRTPEYRAWSNFIDRCENPKNPSFARYGGRGISVSSEWRKSFDVFIADIGSRPSSDHSIDRIDNDLGYSKENCRWSTRDEQATNRGDNRVIEFNGRKQTLYQWAREYNINENTLRGRLRNGWGTENAITKPTQRKKQHSIRTPARSPHQA
jgi:hypothetical protein